MKCEGHPDCLMCSGEACNLCGAGCWSNVANCQHDVLERHMEPPEPGAGADADREMLGGDADFFDGEIGNK